MTKYQYLFQKWLALWKKAILCLEVVKIVSSELFHYALKRQQGTVREQRFLIAGGALAAFLQCGLKV